MENKYSTEIKSVYINNLIENLIESTKNSSNTKAISINGQLLNLKSILFPKNSNEIPNDNKISKESRVQIVSYIIEIKSMIRASELITKYPFSGKDKFELLFDIGDNLSKELFISENVKNKLKELEDLYYMWQIINTRTIYKDFAIGSQVEQTFVHIFGQTKLIKELTEIAEDPNSMS